MTDLHEILRLRIRIFVVEQDCPYQEVDGLDLLEGTEHFWLRGQDDRVTSYLRVLSRADGTRRIGRVCTDIGSRRGGYAAHLVRTAVDAFGAVRIDLHAQAAVVAFYETFGFVPAGPEFDEDGIPHVFMSHDP